MMPYLIDGHNLIGQLDDLSLDDPNDEALLVQKLNGFVARTGRKCVVVFDSGLPGGVSRLSTRGVEVVFASHLSSADQVIMERIRDTPNPKTWTVISSDHQVTASASRRQMQTVPSNQFAQMLQIAKTPEKPGVDVDANVHLSDDEVDDWLQWFDLAMDD